MAKPVQITKKEYQEKRFEAAKDLLASALHKLENFNAIGEDKKLDSMVSNCVFLADNLLAELGYVPQESDTSTVHSLKAILESGEE